MQRPKEFIVIMDSYSLQDSPSTLEQLSYDITEAKNQFNEYLLLRFQEFETTFSSIEDNDLEIFGAYKISFRKEIKNLNYEKELAEYKVWEKAEHEKLQLAKETAEAKQNYKKESQMARVNCFEIAKIIASNKTAIEKQQEIQEQLRKNTIT